MATSSVLLSAASLVTVFAALVSPLHMTSRGSPVVVRNGSEVSVLLDCDYEYERFEAAGLTVKWFWDRDHEPVYQWIPGGVPEVRGILKGRVNVSHRASRDNYTAHRALQILRPTTELSGGYTCSVSSYYDEKRFSVTLLVFAPPASMKLAYHKTSPNTINVSCVAHGLYPRPRVALYARAHSSNRFEIQNADVAIIRHLPPSGLHPGPSEDPVVWESWGEAVNKKTRGTKKGENSFGELDRDVNYDSGGWSRKRTRRGGDIMKEDSNVAIVGTIAGLTGKRQDKRHQVRYGVECQDIGDERIMGQVKSLRKRKHLEAKFDGDNLEIPSQKNKPDNSCGDNCANRETAKNLYETRRRNTITRRHSEGAMTQQQEMTKHSENSRTKDRVLIFFQRRHANKHAVIIDTNFMTTDGSMEGTDESTQVPRTKFATTKPVGLQVQTNNKIARLEILDQKVHTADNLDDGVETTSSSLYSPYFESDPDLENEEDEAVGISYSVHSSVVLSNEQLHDEEQLLECELKLPGTRFLSRRSVLYFPGYDAMELYAQDGSRSLAPGLSLSSVPLRVMVTVLTMVMQATVAS